MTIKKTNAQRILDKEKIPYAAHSYDPSDGLIDGVSVAEKIGKQVHLVFKTLVTRGASGNPLVFVVPVAAELDLKLAAKAAGEKSLAMIPVKDITPLTGYVKGGCSPIGMKKLYPTYIDASAQALPQMVVSAGAIGYQIELAPTALAQITKAKFAEVAINL